jgi:multidrug efflux system membrane fusion protein
MSQARGSRVQRAIGPLVLAALLALAGCEGGAAAPPAAPERPPALVTVATAVARDVPVYLEEIGRCTAREMVAVEPQVSGRITQIYFADGADLNPGDPLFTIDPRPYEAALNQAKATLAQKQAVLDLARIELTRGQVLTRTNAMSRQDYDLKRNAVDVAEAEVLAARAAVDTAALNLEYCTIRAPIVGRAGHRLVDMGNVVTANTNPPLLIIERLDPIYADFTIPENELSSVQANMKSGDLKVEVRLPDRTDAPRTGTLTFLDNLVQDGTGTIKLRATLPNSDHYFWPGRFVKVRLILSTLKQAVLVPAEAVQNSAKGPFVYVVNGKMTAELRPVTLGQRHDELVVVREGVKPEERVVTLGQLAVMPGGAVRIESAAASSAKPEGKS